MGKFVVLRQGHIGEPQSEKAAAAKVDPIYVEVGRYEAETQQLAKAKACDEHGAAVYVAVSTRSFKPQKVEPDPRPRVKFSDV
jgi:hypothetical protein